MKFRFAVLAGIGVASGFLLGLWSGGAAAQSPQQMRALQDRQRNQQQAAQQQQMQNMQMQQMQQRQMQQQQMQGQALRTSGTVDMVGSGGRIQILTADGQSWLLQIMPNAQIEIRGTASPEFLSPGQFVTFVATVDKHAKVEAPVDKLTIFTPDEQHVVGAFPEGAGLPPGGAPGEPGNRGDKGIRPVPVAKVPVPDAAPAAETYEIAGRITKIKNGKMTVSAPNAHFKGTLLVEVAEQAAVDLDLRGTDGLGLVQQGDKIEAVGTQAAERAAKVVQVKIELARPLDPTAEKKKPPRRGAAGRSKGAASAQPPDAPEQGQQ